MKLSIFWFRRDLRLEDNIALTEALNSGFPVQPIFIFDENILHELPKNDSRVNFIYNTLSSINAQLNEIRSSIQILKGKPIEIFKKLLFEEEVAHVFLNKDYEPYAIKRDRKVKAILSDKGIGFHAFKDQVIFEEHDILKNDGNPYTVFTPYKRKWLEKYHQISIGDQNTYDTNNFYQNKYPFPSLAEIGFKKSSIKIIDYNLSQLEHYTKYRDIPGENSTSFLGPHFRFGTVSIRRIMSQLKIKDEIFLSELIWREFFMQILYHFPRVVNENFKTKYNTIVWRNNEDEYKLWCQGNTGYPLVDAGMRQLNATGFMHNRIRMVVASFLCKHLLIDWRWGEAYFALKLLDFELSSNNGNWQWASGTGCDAVPYFRVFNPTLQMNKFDKELKYVKKWIPEYSSDYHKSRMVDHEFARKRAIETYKKGLQSKF